jgi:hypothetical protein
MNCEAARKHLLGSECPDRPSAEVSAHVVACDACREWQQRLVQMESAVRQVSLPRADAARSALVRRILTEKPTAKPKSSPRLVVNGKAEPRPSVARVVGSWIMDPHASPRRRVAAGLVAGVAAALLLFFTGWLIWDATRPAPEVVVSTQRTPPRDPLLVVLDKYGIHISEQPLTPNQRIKEMAGAAEDLRKRAGARVLADNELSAMAQAYTQVVRDGVVKPAKGLVADGVVPEDRQAVLAIADQLARDDSEWKRLSQQTGLSASAQSAVNQAAEAASEANGELRKLFGGS